MEHPFTQYIQTLGKGKRGAKDLTMQDAEQAMALILSHQVDPAQLGAFLMLMRVKEETAEELAGFARAARASIAVPKNLAHVDLDWSSYAGKRRQLPWLTLSALLLASHGVRVLMHGAPGATGRLNVTQALQALGINTAQSIEDASNRIQQANFAYVELKVLSPELQRILDLKSLLGLRSPAHTVVRMLNPFSAPASIIGIFHPGYDVSHQQAAMHLQDNNMAVFKGDGGEAERNPDASCIVRMARAGTQFDEEWPAMFSSRHMKEETMDVSRLDAMWHGRIDDEYGKAAILGTTAIALRTMGRADSIADAINEATRMWDSRDISYLDRIKN